MIFLLFLLQEFDDLEPALTGEGPAPKWKIVREGTNHVLVPDEPDRTDYRFVMAVSKSIKADKGNLWVRFKPVEGAVDRAGGLVWRYQDANNYYVTRANALEGNLRVYKVVQGRRIQLATLKVDVALKRWHTLVVRFEGEHHVVSLDGTAELEVDDDAFKQAGRVGLWTKSDSVTYFDDLTLGEIVKESDDPLIQAHLSLADPRAGRHTFNVLMAAKRDPRPLDDWEKLLTELKFDAVLAGRPGCVDALIGRARKNRSWRDLELALALQPRSIRAQLLAAQFYVAEKNVTEAMKILDRIDPPTVASHLIRGAAHLASKNPKAAIKEYDLAIRLDPEEPRAHYGRSLAWEQEGNHDRSMKNALKAAELAPELPDPRHQVARLYTLQPDYDAAEREFKKALEIDPTYAKSAIGLGWVEAHRGKFEDALPHYDRALKLDPTIAEGWALRGNAKWKLQRVDASIEDYSKAIEINPGLALAWANRGLALAHQKKFAEAVRDFEKAIALEPALQAQIGGDLDKARRELREY